MTRQFTLTDTRDMHGRLIRVGGQAFPRTHTSPAGLQLDLTVGRETGVLDVATSGGRAIVEDLIASLQAALEMGLEISDASVCDDQDAATRPETAPGVDDENVVHVDFTGDDQDGEDDQGPGPALSVVR